MLSTTSVILSTSLVTTDLVSSSMAPPNSFRVAAPWSNSLLQFKFSYVHWFRRNESGTVALFCRGALRDRASFLIPKAQDGVGLRLRIA